MTDDVEMSDMTQQKPTQPNSKLATLPFIEKYRPSDMKEVISQDEIVSILSKLIEHNSLPHLLFYGPAGTGKTTCAKAISKKLFGQSAQFMTLDLNASNDRGINVVRQSIKDFCSTLTVFSQNMNKKHKLIILDEADMMTSDAQGALRRVIEKYTSNTRFVLICNQVNKIHPAIQSRCMKFRFKPIEHDKCIDRLKYICTQEGIKYKGEETLSAIMKIGKNDMRKILNLLEAAFMSSKDGEDLDVNHVYETAGLPTIRDFYELVKNISTERSIKKAYDNLNIARLSKGYSVEDLLMMMSDYIEYKISNGGFARKLKNEELIEVYKSLRRMNYIVRKGGQEEVCLKEYVAMIREYNIE